MSVFNDIKNEIQRLKLLNYQGPFKIVPVVNKRCFAPCGDGRCNCHARIGKDYTLVQEKYFKGCMQDVWRDQETLQRCLDDYVAKDTLEMKVEVDLSVINKEKEDEDLKHGLRVQIG